MPQNMGRSRLVLPVKASDLRLAPHGNRIWESCLNYGGEELVVPSSSEPFVLNISQIQYVITIVYIFFQKPRSNAITLTSGPIVLDSV
jgi:hypothetical protein